MIPEPHVLERCRVALDVIAREQHVAGQLAFLDPVEGERAPRRLDVVLDVRRFPRLLVRRDDETLEQRAVDLAARGYDDVDPDCQRDRPVARGGRLPRRKDRPRNRGDDEQQGSRHSSVHIGIARAEDHA